MTHWGDLFSARQALTISTLARLTARAAEKLKTDDPALTDAVATVLGLAVSRFTDICNALCMWEPSKTQVRHMFTRQAIGMLWDFAEPNVLAQAAGNFAVTLGTMIEVLKREAIGLNIGHIEQASATHQVMPEDSAQAIITDPPYYDAVTHAHLSDLFYVWLKRTLHVVHPDLFKSNEVPKAEEVVVDRPHELSESSKDIPFYERELTKTFVESRRVLHPEGVATIVFASKTTSSWEAILQAVVDAGWVITGSWPIDTEMENRVAAQGQARLASSVHLVCRPRENSDGTLRATNAGEWRDVLDELPQRIREWMPRLDKEGVSGADAIFACLGPALEIFSRYSRVERADGTPVTLREHLEQVWAAVAREALALVFEGADASGMEADARLTAMWLWTLRSSPNGQSAGDGDTFETEGESEEDTESEADDASPAPTAKGSFSLEFDAARKIAQGLGAHLEALSTVVEVKGHVARLLSVAERQPFLFEQTRDSATSDTSAGPSTSGMTSGKGRKGRKPAKGQQAFGEDCTFPEVVKFMRRPGRR